MEFNKYLTYLNNWSKLIFLLFLLFYVSNNHFMAKIPKITQILLICRTRRQRHVPKKCINPLRAKLLRYALQQGIAIGSTTVVLHKGDIYEITNRYIKKCTQEKIPRDGTLYVECGNFIAAVYRSANGRCVDIYNRKDVVLNENFSVSILGAYVARYDGVGFGCDIIAAVQLSSMRN